MIFKDKNSIKGLNIFLLGISFSFFFSFAALAQGEKEKGMQDFPRNPDDLGQLESSEFSQLDWRQENQRLNAIKPLEGKNPNNQNLLRKENPIYRQGGEKDGRKEGMSTLSFNLFLYIVDKFRED
ncbi:hypothetical protein B879_01912 [Cecembia lonarensis LW9]|uniref:Uncharacterized protein n=2 Tax=Cecembia TaxID=1187078 RepID=K1KZA5_CECL9|nr:hypothetical protein B879_01912 [Cecembia lonarensis LW9]